MQKNITATFAAIVWVLPLFSQTDFEYNLTRTIGPKVILLGEWKAEGAAKWKRVIDSDGICEHGFALLSRGHFKEGAWFGIEDGDIDDFERYLRQRHGLSNSVAWLALNLENNLIASGVIVPSSKEFDEMLEKNGVKTPARILREFLRENPNHLDAKTDLLKEVRRRALMRLPADVTEDHDTETDLKIWGVLANETDNVFKGDWMGIDLNFFRPDQEQPEIFSKLMKAVFRKHIATIESAVREQPADMTLWNIWAWMARGITDYKWSSFTNTLEPFVFPALNVAGASPSPDVCVWLVEDSMRKKDWETAIKFAKIARRFSTIRTTAGEKTEWSPGTRIVRFMSLEQIKDYPAKSAYAPHLEALLRLGKLDEANDVYDEMIRFEGKTALNRHETNNARIAANAARTAGMKELAEIWERGEPINKAAYANISPYSNAYGLPTFYTYAQFRSEYYEKFSEQAGKISPKINVYPGPGLEENIDTLGWKREDGDRWALIDADLLLLEQGYGLPDSDMLQAVLDRHNIKDDLDYARSYMSEHGAKPGLELKLAFEIISRNLRTLDSQKNNTPDTLNPGWDDDSWAEASNYLKKILASHSDILVNLPFALRYDVSIQSKAIKSLSKPLLGNIELLLKQKPSSDTLWTQWFFWRGVEDAGRPIEPLVETVIPSPVTKPGTVPPANALADYYEECKRNEKWSKVIALLRTVWDREYARITNLKKRNPDIKLSAPAERSASGDDWQTDYILSNAHALGDNVCIPLIEAYLMDNKPNGAREIFNAWLECGGVFNDTAKIIELAKKNGQERLAREWESFRF